jgi:Fe-S cluster assembly protein SufD
MARSPFPAVEPAALGGDEPLSLARARALARYQAHALPTDAEEIWRYSRVNELDPGAWVPAPRPSGVVLPAEVPAAALVTVDGYVYAITNDGPARVEVASADIDTLTAEAEPRDPFVELNTAQAPEPVLIDVPPHAVVDEPIVVVHWAESTGTAMFPRVIVRVGDGAEVTVVEHHLSGDVLAWSDPVTELHVGDGAHLRYVTVQELGLAVWQTAYLGARVGRDAVLRTATVALGGDYARSRTDSVIVGAGGSAELAALYCGSGTQMHDFRTLQDHVAPKSFSDLLFKGAVADEARSAYSGLIRVRRGAAGTHAFQTNRNLVLSDTGLATYSVPNLDIEENDVSCSHASATGPIDADQRFYLESRGVPPEAADRLIVLGFFSEVVERLPIAMRGHVAQVIGAKLRVGVGDG